MKDNEKRSRVGFDELLECARRGHRRLDNDWSASASEVDAIMRSARQTTDRPQLDPGWLPFCRRGAVVACALVVGVLLIRSVKPDQPETQAQDPNPLAEMAGW